MIKFFKVKNNTKYLYSKASLQTLNSSL